MKRIVVNVAGATNEYRDLTIEPGTTTNDILKELDLQGYQLSRDGADDILGPDENVYVAVADGTKLIAEAPMTVGEPRIVKKP